MSKFKVGDKVTLKPREPGWADLRPFYIGGMVDDCDNGVVFTVKRVGTNNIDLGLWSVREDWIEHVLVSLDNI